MSNEKMSLPSEREAIPSEYCSKETTKLKLMTAQKTWNSSCGETSNMKSATLYRVYVPITLMGKLDTLTYHDHYGDECCATTEALTVYLGNETVATYPAGKWAKVEEHHHTIWASDENAPL